MSDRSLTLPAVIRLLDRRGFTLVELLVVMGILLIISAMTLSVINVSITGDRTRGAARQVQSMLEGARSHAIYGGKNKGARYQAGVRFIRDPNAPNFITSLQMVEIDPANALDEGDFEIEYDGSTPPQPTRLVGNLATRYAGNPRYANSEATNWYFKYQQGLIFDYQTIQLDHRKYQFRTTSLDSNNDVLVLTTPYVGGRPGPFNSPNPNVAVDVQSQPDYQILLAPQPMANQEPRVLGNGIVIDLSTLPIDGYQMSKGLDFFISENLPIDIMFSPRGTVVGQLSGTGIVQFVISDREDSLKKIPLPNTTTPNPAPKRERLIVSLTPQTGKAAVHPVYIQSAGQPDPYRYSETGEVAGQ